MGLPYHGTYTADDGVQKITISSTNSSNGQIKGSYESAYTPVGPLSVSASGNFNWVNNKSLGRDGVAPFNIRFSALQRPDGRPYCIVDEWNGAYTTDNTMVLAGTRALVKEDGDIQAISLGTKVFSM